MAQGLKRWGSGQVAPREFEGSSLPAQLFYDTQSVVSRLPSAIELIVAHKHRTLISNPIIQKLLDEKWNGFGRRAVDLCARAEEINVSHQQHHGSGHRVCHCDVNCRDFATEREDARACRAFQLAHRP